MVDKRNEFINNSKIMRKYKTQHLSIIWTLDELNDSKL